MRRISNLPVVGNLFKQSLFPLEAPDGSTGADGMTLNINVNVGEDGTTDQEAEDSPQQQNEASWYQVAVLCLLSAILVCVIKKR